MNQLNQQIQLLGIGHPPTPAQIRQWRDIDHLIPSEVVARYITFCLLENINTFYTLDCRVTGNGQDGNINRDLWRYFISLGFISYSAKTTGTSWVASSTH